MPLKRVTVEILKAGNGIDYPKPGNVVTVHYDAYRGRDHIKFDSSRDRGKPFKFKLGGSQVIEGLDDGVSQLSVGEHATLRIPASLAYGKHGFPGLIPPSTELTFDVELISFS